ncbi:PREDICTED: E3 ubiquitin-protein ligase RNF180-like [Eufriesea mexicana]|uniref:E3 ubiquitin-protein ligase RNF180-like n=1 Tax=Eufriesea mexicana TaxID=516756 RepID=UPI00083BCC0A|nr:PREDICTED: E3 ubiquitin-protein ligase RNF180-like [Eufriesea mexicana]
MHIRQVMEVKCKHCRKDLFGKECISLLTSHNEIKTNFVDVFECGTNDFEPCSYISMEKLPKWIEQAINQESWTKGRLHCPHCNNRIGSFNFVNELKCNCSKFIAPPVKITNSKVDILFLSE